MGQRRDIIDQESVELIKELMEQERMAMEQHRRQASRTAEPQLQSLIARLTATHQQSYEELRAFLGEVDSQNVITQQINEMFL